MRTARRRRLRVRRVGVAQLLQPAAEQGGEPFGTGVAERPGRAVPDGCRGLLHGEAAPPEHSLPGRVPSWPLADVAGGAVAGARQLPFD